MARPVQRLAPLHFSRQAVGLVRWWPGKAFFCALDVTMHGSVAVASATIITFIFWSSCTMMASRVMPKCQDVGSCVDRKYSMFECPPRIPPNNDTEEQSPERSTSGQFTAVWFWVFSKGSYSVPMMLMNDLTKYDSCTAVNSSSWFWLLKWWCMICPLDRTGNALLTVNCVY